MPVIGLPVLYPLAPTSEPSLSKGPATSSSFTGSSTTPDALDAAEHGYILSPTRVTFLRDLNEAESIACGKQIAGNDQAAKWQMGDWLVHTGRTGVFRNRNGAMGSAYAFVEEVTGLRREVLSSRYRVAEAFPPDTVSRGTVSWTIHLIVLRVLPDLRNELLQKFSREKATVADAVLHIDTLDAATQRDTHRPPPSGRRRRDYVLAEVRCPNVVVCAKCSHPNPCRTEFPIRGHKVERSKETV